MKRAVKLIILVLAFLLGLVSCVPRAVVVEPIAPRAAIVHEQAKATAASSKRAAAASISVHVQASGIAAEVAQAFAEVDRLKKSDSSPDRFTDLVALMTDLSAHSQPHVGSAAEADQRAKEADAAQTAVVESSGILVSSATKADAAVVDMTIKTAAAQSDADKWRALKFILIFGGVILILGDAFFLYLRLT